MLFVLAPPLDLFRLDLTLGHFILFGHAWTLGLDAFLRGEVGAGDAALNLLLRGLLPIALVIGGVIAVAWRWGRLYCGWLCPHFSVVEIVNGLMRRAAGRFSIWERQRLPERSPDGKVVVPNAAWWPVVIIAVVAFALLWAVVLLTYLLPPVEVYRNLFTANLTRNQFLFIAVATTALSVEFLLARHLFCRYACAAGLFQSLAWLGNRDAMVVGFDTKRARLCQSCDNACDNACPMRLKPRTLKRKMFTCTQCARCITACEQVQAPHSRPSLLEWKSGPDAHAIAEPTLGNRPGGAAEKPVSGKY